MQLSLSLSRLYSFLESNKKKVVYLPLWLYWVILFALTSIPAEGLPTFGISDKVEHLIAYFLLSILLQLTLHFQNKFLKLKKRHALYTAIVGCLYGIVDELHQHLIPGRYCDLLDLVSNFVGVFLAVGIVTFFINTVSQLKEYKS